MKIGSCICYCVRLKGVGSNWFPALNYLHQMKMHVDRFHNVTLDRRTDHLRLHIDRQDADW